MADSDNDVVIVRNDDIDDIGPAFVNAPVIMKRFEKVLNEVSLMYDLARKSKEHMNIFRGIFGCWCVLELVYQLLKKKVLCVKLIYC